MKIIIKTTNLELNQELRDFIEEKIGSLESFAKVFQSPVVERFALTTGQSKNYYNHFFGKGKPRVEVWVEIGRTTKHHQKGDIFRAEAQMCFPNRSIRAESERDDLKLAITEIKDELQQELKKYKGKTQALAKRKTRSLKKILRLSPLARFKKPKGSREREEGI